MKKNKTLHYIFPLTGPNNGVKILSNYILKKLFNNSLIVVKTIDTAQAKDHSNFGKFSIKKIFQSLKLFARVLKIKSTDLVYINLTPKGFAYYRDLLLLWLCKLKTNNITAHIHANGLEKNMNFFSSHLLRKIKVIVINKDQEAKLDTHINYLFRVDNSLPDFYDSNFVFSRRELKENIDLIFLSNLSVEKGIDRLQFIADLIREKKLKVKLNIYGGVLTKLDEEKILKLKNDYKFLNYFGAINDSVSKNKVLRDNDALLFLSDENYEVYPLVYIESMMNGLPIVSTKQIVTSNLKKQGLVFELDEDLNNFVEIFNELSEQILKEDSLKNKVRNIYKEKYSFDDFIYKLEQIILHETHR